MDNYEDIINLEHPEPKRHIRMSIYERSSQFAPFAALEGYEDSVQETARLTSKKHELTEEEKLKINDFLVEIYNKRYHPSVKVIYFLPDNKKNGGEYKELSGILTKIDKYKQLIYIDKLKIEIENIYSIEKTGY